jgi:hypothetical protein
MSMSGLKSMSEVPRRFDVFTGFRAGLGFLTFAALFERHDVAIEDG